MIKLDIDGKELTVKQGTSIIEAADNAGINIPRFCYHKKLSVAANCRMCLVEVVNAPKPMPACATPVAEGMQVKTKSPKALLAQRAVMEFLLINHPLDCPICDQGGECELQDVSMGYGEGISKYNLGKRSVKDENIGPLIATGMTRCIHCTRCVRFGEEVAGIKELGGLGRGEDTEIRTYINNSVDSELSGNMIDVCPVGALTSKPFRFSARAWELRQYPSIAPHDPIGSNISVHSVKNTVKRVVPRENEEINEVWLSDRDRFSYEALNHKERLFKPLIRKNDILQACDWETALTETVKIIKDQVKASPHDLIALLSPNSTVEEGYLLQKIVRNLGSNNIDFRLKTITDLELGVDNISLAELEQSKAILLIGACPRKSIPLLNHRIRKAAINGAKVNTLNLAAYDWNYDLAVDNIVSASELVNELSGVLKQLYKLKEKDIPVPIRKIKVSEKAKVIAENLFNSEKPVLILGDLAVRHPDSHYIYVLYQNIKTLLDGAGLVLSEGANSKGLMLAGALPHRQAGGYKISKPGDTVDTVFDRADGIGTYILFNIDPEYDCKNGSKALAKLNKSKKVISISPFVSDNINNYADVVLPLAPFTETSGTFVNIDNKWQTFVASVPASKSSQVRPGWKILTAIAKLLDLSSEEFDYESSSDVKQEVFGLSSGVTTISKINNVSSEPVELLVEDYKSKIVNNKTDDLVKATLITETNCYKTDNIVRRAESLQQTTDAKHGQNIFISLKLAEQLGQVSGESLGLALDNNLETVIRLNAVVDDRLPDDTVYVTTGYKDTLGLDKTFEQVILINKK